MSKRLLLAAFAAVSVFAVQPLNSEPLQRVVVTESDVNYHVPGCPHIFSGTPKDEALDVAARTKDRCPFCDPPTVAGMVSPALTDVAVDERGYYHWPGCISLGESQYRIAALKDAVMTQAPCSICRAPRLRGTAQAGTAGTGVGITPAKAYEPSATGASSSGSDRVHVKGYKRKDGTYVAPHTRSRPKKRN